MQNKIEKILKIIDQGSEDREILMTYKNSIYPQTKS